MDLNIQTLDLRGTKNTGAQKCFVMNKVQETKNRSSGGTISDTPMVKFEMNDRSINEEELTPVSTIFYLL